MANLAQPAFQTRYVMKCLDVFKDWTTLAPNQRANAVVGELNSILTNNLQVPALRTNMGRSLAANTYGQLDFRTWTIQLNFNLWSRSSITLEQMGKLCVTVYHETRHAEQWYRVGQGVAAGQFVPPAMGPVGRLGPTSEQIARALWLDLGIARDAEQKKRFFNVHVPVPMLPLVEGWFNSIYGTGALHRRTVLADTSRQGFIDYRHLPEEDDAHKVEQGVRAIWKLKQPGAEDALEGLTGLFAPQLVTYREWIANTSRNMMHFRSADLKELDRRLQTYDGTRTPANLRLLQEAFDRWYRRNPHEASARNKDSCVQNLKAFLEESSLDAAA